MRGYFRNHRLEIAAGCLCLRHYGPHHAAAQYLFLRVTEKALGELVEKTDAAVASPTQDDAVGVLNELSVFLLGEAQGIFRLPALGDVVYDRQDEGLSLRLTSAVETTAHLVSPLRVLTRSSNSSSLPLVRPISSRIEVCVA